MTYAKIMRAAQEYVVKERPENIGDAADELSPGTSAFWECKDFRYIINRQLTQQPKFHP